MKKTLSAIIALLLTGTPGTARADGYLTPGEEGLGDSMSSAVCQYIDNNGVTLASMTSVARVIYQQPEIADMGDSVDVINYIVSNFCPEHWDELVSFGEGARA